jgi:uncharacterized protein
MKVTVSGATGLIGSRLIEELKRRGDEVTVLSRNPDAARASLGVEAVRWSPMEEPAPAEALAGRDGVVHLAGENVGQRWTDETRRRIRDSRIAGTGNLVAGLRRADPRPGVLVAASAVGYYGARGDEVVEESTPPGDDFLAAMVRDWEAATDEAADAGLRVVKLRTGVVLDAQGGALGRMLPFFKAGVGGPVAGGGQYMPWVHPEDVVGLQLAALERSDWEGVFNATAPAPVTNKEFSRALGRALNRPAVLPVPAAGLKVLYGEMSLIVTTGQRAVPRRALEHGYEFRHTDLDEALRSALEEA